MFKRNTLLLLLLLATAVACGGSEEGSTTEQTDATNRSGVYADGAFKIVATTTQANDIAQILTDGVANVEITPLMGAGVDPHLYQPTESDIAAMNDADMVIYSGLFLEGQFDTVFAALREQGVLIHALSDPVKQAGFTIGGFELSDELVDVDDPHFWFDPRNWELTIVDLGEALAGIDPDNSDVYTQNATEYAATMTPLYEWANEGLRSVPEGQRYLVTSHDAFQYFGAAFGWQMEAIQGLSTEDEAGVGDIQGTVDFIIENQIPVVFVESSIPPDTIEAVIEAVEAEGGSVRIGVREMYSDAMGELDTFAGTYVGMLASNTLTVLQSYQCAGVPVTLPEWPVAVTPTPPDALLNGACDQ
ncbi:metal ABC transporter solute-binding protein, Zn/Mn family [Candidatus Leptofilum sp.]|uniref:metal ABC transporter solute-binding protein, Zn/Mn family n=1 Tax=Candidatus Leptofilum sp. TaxID=3241576 RepID=UPI003B593CDE